MTSQAGRIIDKQVNSALNEEHESISLPVRSLWMGS